MNKKNNDPYLLDTEKCIENVGNKFDLVLIAAIRTRELNRGYTKKVKETNSLPIIALREIEAGHIGKEYLRKV
jgi:DNA-directed RNA polymerase subunit omega